VDIIREYYPESQIYAYISSNRVNLRDEVIPIYNYNNIFQRNYYAAFISNPTFLHVSTAIDCAKNNINLFIEKPLSHSLESVIYLRDKVDQNNLISYVAYNLRFHPILQYLKDLITKEKPYYFKSTCSSYLPNWRPSQDYRTSYSSDGSKGGGVVLDVSHEIDYINWFNEIKSMKMKIGKVSNLEINSEDVADIQVKCKDFEGLIHLDYFSRVAERTIKLYFEDKNVYANLIENKVTIVNHDRTETIDFESACLDLSYRQQIKYFFNCVNDGKNPMNSLSESLPLFEKIIKAKESAEIYGKY